MLVICACDIFSCWDILGVWASVPRDRPGLKIFWTQISVLLFLFQALSRRGGFGDGPPGPMEKDESIARCLGPS